MERKQRKPLEKHLYAIPNRCTGCMRCALACSASKEGIFMPSKSRIKITNFPLEGYSVPSICFQCPKADCVKACPEEAIFKNERGVVVINVNKCNGCGDCVGACPWGMIEQYKSGKAYKCDLCGGNPACVAECEFDALVFKEADRVSKVLRAAQMRQRYEDGSPQEKRQKMADAILKSEVRVPRTVGYMGEKIFEKKTG